MFCSIVSNRRMSTVKHVEFINIYYWGNFGLKMLQEYTCKFKPKIATAQLPLLLVLTYTLFTVYALIG